MQLKKAFVFSVFISKRNIDFANYKIFLKYQ